MSPRTAGRGWQLSHFSRPDLRVRTSRVQSLKSVHTDPCRYSAEEQYAAIWTAFTEDCQVSGVERSRGSSPALRLEPRPLPRRTVVLRENSVVHGKSSVSTPSSRRARTFPWHGSRFGPRYREGFQRFIAHTKSWRRQRRSRKTEKYSPSNEVRPVQSTLIGVCRFRERSPSDAAVDSIAAPIKTVRIGIRTRLGCLIDRVNWMQSNYQTSQVFLFFFSNFREQARSRQPTVLPN